MGKVIESYSGKSIPSKTYATYVELYVSPIVLFLGVSCLFIL